MSYAGEFAALKKKHKDSTSFEGAYAFLDLHARTAKALEKTNPLEALNQYRLAESCQQTIGSFATGSGEGLASMADLYRLMAKRAALEESIAQKAQNDGDPATALVHLESALEIWKEIGGDPNTGKKSAKPKLKIAHFEAEVARVKKQLSKS